MKNKNLVENLKNILIAVLSVSALLLAYFSGFFGNTEIIQDTIFSNGNDITQTVITHQITAPMTVVVTGAEESHTGIKYNSSELSEVSAWLSASMGEALGTASSPTEVAVSSWEFALKNQGVFIDYLNSIPLSLLAGSLGVEMTLNIENHSARRFCLAVQGDAVSLYYINSDDGKFYQCNTGLDSVALVDRISNYYPNNSLFAFETDGNENIDPYYVIVPRINSSARLTAVNSLQNAGVATRLQAFDMGAYTVNFYTEVDGTAVYIENDKILRISPEGIITYSFSGAGDEVDISLSDVVSKAFETAYSLPISSVAQLALSSITELEDGSCEIEIDYIYNSIPIVFSNRKSAMEFVFSGSGELIEANIICRSFDELSTQNPLPDEQQLAISNQLGGREPMLCYVNSGSGMSLEWIIRTFE